MSEEKQAQTIEIDVPAEAPAVEEKPSVEDLKDSGLTKVELEKAKKFGLVRDTNEEPKKNEPTSQIKAPEVEQPKEKKNGNLPEFKFKTPEQEKAWLEAFGPGTEQRAMYFRMKNERQQRQNAEEERDRLAIKIRALEEQFGYKNTENVPVDENGQEVDPEDKPLTLRQLRELQKKEREELERSQQEAQNSGSKVRESLLSQEEYARTIYPDYEETVKLAGDVIKNVDGIFSSKWEQDRAIELMKHLQIRVANADKFGIDDYNAALISYEIGKLHPKYGKKADDGAIEATEKVNGGLTPEQKKLERIENNATRRSSSASVTGAPGKRVISAEDVTLQDLNAMPESQFREFRKKNRDIVNRLLRSA